VSEENNQLQHLCDALVKFIAWHEWMQYTTKNASWYVRLTPHERMRLYLAFDEYSKQV